MESTGAGGDQATPLREVAVGAEEENRETEDSEPCHDETLGNNVSKEEPGQRGGVLNLCEGTVSEYARRSEKKKTGEEKEKAHFA